MLKIFQKVNFLITYLFSNNLNEKKLFKQLLSKDSIIIVDIGSNYGNFYKNVIKIFKNKNITVHSVEPNSKLLEKQNISHGELIKHPLAISNNNGEQEFYIRKISSNSSLLNINYLDNFGNKKINKINVKTITLNSFFQLFELIEVDILKIDIEGYESKIISDIPKILKFCDLNFIKIEIVFKNLDSKYNDDNFQIIYNNLYNSDFHLIGFTNIKYENQKLFYCDAIFQNRKYLNI